MLPAILHDIHQPPFGHDFILRNSLACGVPYGVGMERTRLVRALTVSARVLSGGKCRMNIAYGAKGRAAVESMVFARYQMYVAVYWHHAFRAVVSMFGYALVETFGKKKVKDRYRNIQFTQKDLQKLFYLHIVSRQEWSKIFLRLFRTPEVRTLLTEPAPA